MLRVTIQLHDEIFIVHFNCSFYARLVKLSELKTPAHAHTYIVYKKGLISLENKKKTNKQKDVIKINAIKMVVNGSVYQIHIVVLTKKKGFQLANSDSNYSFCDDVSYRGRFDF